jgi:phosphoribosylanthranilate isomerase
MWVKICGITSVTDALMCVAMGADALGFVMAPSPRQMSALAVKEITRTLPPEVVTVGVFRDQGTRVLDMALEAGVQAVQLHGHEGAAEVAALRDHINAVIVALPAGSPRVERFPEYGADLVLLDAADPGSGETFDWDLARQVPDGQRIVLAGGLTHDNVAHAVAAVRPWGVDVSTGVESAPGVKDVRLVRRFINAARLADGLNTPGQFQEAAEEGWDEADWRHEDTGSLEPAWADPDA